MPNYLAQFLKDPQAPGGMSIAGRMDPSVAWDYNRPMIAEALKGAWTAAQDPQTWRDAANQYAQALLMGSIAPELKVPRYWVHGTSGKFDRFDMSRAGSVSSGAGEGIWLTRNPRYADEYAQNSAHITGEEPQIINVEAMVKNPFVVAFDRNGKPIDAHGNRLDFFENMDAIKYAREQGHDSIYWPDSTFTDDGATLTLFRADDATIRHDLPYGFGTTSEEMLNLKK